MDSKSGSFLKATTLKIVTSRVWRQSCDVIDDVANRRTTGTHLNHLVSETFSIKVPDTQIRTYTDMSADNKGHLKVCSTRANIDSQCWSTKAKFSTNNGTATQQLQITANSSECTKL